jgi:O-antigen/teichoic acid export membrane protein
MTVEASQERIPQRSASGARSGVLLAGASGVSIVAAYVFLLAAGRILGSEDYGSLAALLGLLAVVLIPAGALQMAVSREISRRVASGDSAGAARLARGTLRLALLATVPLMVIALALAAPLSDLLHIHSVGLVVFAVSTLATALVFPVALGVL